MALLLHHHWVVAAWNCTLVSWWLFGWSAVFLTCVSCGNFFLTHLILEWIVYDECRLVDINSFWRLTTASKSVINQGLVTLWLNDAELLLTKTSHQVIRLGSRSLACSLAWAWPYLTRVLFWSWALRLTRGLASRLVLHCRNVTATCFTLIWIWPISLLFVINELFVLIKQTLLQFIVCLRILRLVCTLWRCLVALKILQSSMSVVLMCPMRSHDRALSRCNQFAMLASSNKLWAVLTGMRSKLIMNLNIIETGVVRNLIYRLELVIAYRLAVEIDRTRWWLLNLRAASDFIEHG